MVTTATPPAPADVTVKPATTAPRRPAPFDVFDTLQEEMARLWGQGWPFSLAPFGRRFMQTTPLAIWAPRIDVFEQGAEVVVKAELPGAKKEDIQVTLEEGDLVIRGERKAETEVKEEHYYRMERSTGSFYRRVPLPFETTAEAVKATFTDGVLEVRVPKPVQAERPAAKTITVT